ncbi:Uncharacterised protein [Chlamydia trachomatis]|nr:Uncharacterised protein [Chlamydia trachomatis]
MLLVTFLGVIFEVSLVEILSRVFFSNLINPILNWFCNNSPIVTILLFTNESGSSSTPMLNSKLK